MAPSVAILGGGVGGLTAAHELAERGFEVTVYEARPEPGGTARSMPVRGSGKVGRSDLPAEHGFRFFPGFYGRPGRPQQAHRPGGAPQTLDDVQALDSFLRGWASQVGIPAAEQAGFLERLSSCDERRFEQCDRMSRWDFSGASQRGLREVLRRRAAASWRHARAS